jgi:hypothetical protein
METRSAAIKTPTPPQTDKIPHHSPDFPIGGDALNQSPDHPESRASIPPDSPEFPIGGDALNERQHAAIELLVLGLATGQVAQRLDIDRKTLFNWRQNESFQRELQRKRQELWSEVGHRIRALAHPSLDEMERQLSDPYDRTRFGAAVTILKLSNIGKACEKLDEKSR